MNERLARSAIISLVGGLVGAASGLALAIVVGRGLGVADTGTFFAVVAVFAIAANVLELGADTGLVRFVSAARARGADDDVPALLRVALGPVLVTGGVVVVASAVVGSILLPPVSWWPASPGLLAAVGSTLVVGMALIAVFLGASRGLGSVVPFTLVQSIGLPLGRVLAVAALLTSGAGLGGALAAWVAPVPVLLVVAVAVTLRQIRAAAGGRLRPTPARSATVRRPFWSFTVYRGAAAAVEILLEWADVVVVAVLASPADAGIYAVATRAVRAGQVVLQASRVAVSPSISAALATGDLEAASRLHRSVTTATILGSWPIYLTFLIFAPTVLALFGADFTGGSMVLVGLALVMLLVSAAGMVQSLLLMGGRGHQQLINKTCALLTGLALNLLLIPWIGVAGAVVAFAASAAVDTALAAGQVRRVGVAVVDRSLVTPVVVVVLGFGGPALGARLLLGESLPAMALGVVVGGVVLAATVLTLRRRLVLPSAGRQPVATG